MKQDNKMITTNVQLINDVNQFMKLFNIGKIETKIVMDTNTSVGGTLVDCTISHDSINIQPIIKDCVGVGTYKSNFDIKLSKINSTLKDSIYQALADKLNVSLGLIGLKVGVK